MKFIKLIMIMFVVAGCEASVSLESTPSVDTLLTDTHVSWNNYGTPAPGAIVRDPRESGISRWVDSRYGVVCYSLSWDTLSCVRISP